MDELVINEHISIPAWELSFSASRSSGPGGQSVNKTNSRVTLSWHIDSSSVLRVDQKARLKRRLIHRIDGDGYIHIHSETERSQLRNKEDARGRLAQLVAAALERPKRRRATRPTRASKERRLQSKKEHSQKKAMRRKPPES